MNNYTDRELLVLAAKAARLVGHDGLYAVPDDSTGEWRDWNPLNDDGDALRLAVKLKLHVAVYAAEAIVWFNRGYLTEYEYDCKDKFAATRRAIVRAAAAIGEKL